MQINADLQNTIDATKAMQLSANANTAFIGTQKGGDFDIPANVALKFIKADESNQQVVRRWINADDITSRSKGKWIINFEGMELTEAQRFKQPFKYVKDNIKPSRDESRDQASKQYWWQLQRSRPALRAATENLKRYIGTPRVAKHRMFVWVDMDVVPDSRVVAIARDDDYFFGVLHSWIHEAWSLRLASWHGVGNDPTYNAQSCFETFPFPWSSGKEDTASPHHAAISAAAAQLHAEREAWLNPPDLIALGADSVMLRERTLTNLYNAVVAFREGRSGNGNGEKLVKPARDFAPRMVALHDVLDAAVLAAYGWSDLVGRLRSAEGDEELLRRLLALNSARSTAAPV
jgi:hypothetical protein